MTQKSFLTFSLSQQYQMQQQQKIATKVIVQITGRNLINILRLRTENSLILTLKGQIVLVGNNNCMQEDNFKDFSQNIDVSLLSADLKYLLILPFTSQQASKPANHETVPYIITYPDQQIKLNEIITKITQLDQKYKDVIINLTLRSGLDLNNSYSIRDVQKMLMSENINGMQMFMQLVKRPKYYDGNKYSNQCCVTQYLDKQIQTGNVKFYDITVQIPQTKNKIVVFPLRIQIKITGQELIEGLIKNINTYFGVKLMESDIAEIMIEKKVTLNKSKLLLQPIYNKSILTVYLKSTNITLQRAKAKGFNSVLKIYREEQKGATHFQYSQIANLTVEQIYKRNLQLQESEKKIQAIFSLKIMDIIIKPNQTISKAEKYFKNQTNDLLTVVGKVVNEKMIFYHHMSLLTLMPNEFSLEKIKIKIIMDQQQRGQFRKIAESRAASTPNAYFQICQHIQPIMIYTAEIKYEEKPGSYPTIYGSLNKHLRDQPIFTLEQDIVKTEWRYRYSSTLLKHLQKISPYKGIVYRGINYQPQCKVGNILTFKSFLSTSKQTGQAIKFANQKPGNPKYLFEMTILGGYPIKQYSKIMKEDEVLLEPFCQFQLVSINKDNKFPGFIIYKLNQIQTSKKLPDIKANYIIWMEQRYENMDEAYKIFKSVQMTQVTVFRFLPQTQDLKKWLFQYSNLLKDPTARVIFLSNMTRKQGQYMNKYAGIDGYQEIRKYSNEVPVFFYIGNKEAVTNKFKQRNVSLDGVQLGSKQKEVTQFLTKQLHTK